MSYQWKRSAATSRRSTEIPAAAFDEAMQKAYLKTRAHQRSGCKGKAP